MKQITLCLLFISLYCTAFAQQADYLSEDVKFANTRDSLTLAGTFSFPRTKGKYFPAVKCPVLAMNGAKDVQVISSINLAGWQKGIPNVAVKELPGLNRLFQECKTCSVQNIKPLHKPYPRPRWTN